MNVLYFNKKYTSRFICASNFNLVVWQMTYGFRVFRWYWDFWHRVHCCFTILRAPIFFSYDTISYRWSVPKRLQGKCAVLVHFMSNCRLLSYIDSLFFYLLQLTIDTAHHFVMMTTRVSDWNERTRLNISNNSCQDILKSCIFSVENLKYFFLDLHK